MAVRALKPVKEKKVYAWIGIRKKFGVLSQTISKREFCSAGGSGGGRRRATGAPCAVDWRMLAVCLWWRRRNAHPQGRFCAVRIALSTCAHTHRSDLRFKWLLVS